MSNSENIIESHQGSIVCGDLILCCDLAEKMATGDLRDTYPSDKMKHWIQARFTFVAPQMEGLDL